MAVANAWTSGHPTVPTPQFRPPLHSASSPFDCSIAARKSSAIRFSRRHAAIILRCHKSSRLYCHCSAAANSSGTAGSSSASEWDWNRWTRHFSEIEQAESFASLLKFQLEDAIENEDFHEAAKLKTAVAEATLMDSVAEIMLLLKSAVDEERYHDASRLCRITGSGLVGWWVGYSKDSDDPFGRLIRITPGVGRFLARSYSPRQLVTSSPGTPLFEIFVVKDAEETYTMQVVFLQRVKGSTETSPSSSNSKSSKGPSTAEIENASEVDIKVSEKKSDQGDEKGASFEVATEEGIKSVINFLKDKIPELKVKVLKVNVTEEIRKDSDAVEQLKEENSENTMSRENSGDEAGNLDDIQPDRVALGGGSDTVDDGKNLDAKLFIGGVLHNKEDTFSKEEYVRVPAEIKDMERDSFTLHVPTMKQDHNTEESIASKVKVAVQGVSELMPPEVAKVLWSSDKVSSKVSKEMREIVKLAVSQAQKRDRLSEYTSLRRIITSRGDLDPFDGLYVGAFGPYGTEIVELSRKFGNWNGLNDAEKLTEVEFFEYVEAVKLTGDLNVPAGKVIFRAKIGKGASFANRGMYPDELGVVRSYEGQGQIAEFGFRNPKWVEGELLQLNGKGMGPYVKGADLGFLYVVPEQSFLVLFSRLKLPA